MENYQNTKERRAQEVERYSILVTKSLNTLIKFQRWDILQRGFEEFIERDFRDKKIHNHV